VVCGVTTAAAARFGRDDFRLIEWFPRDSGRRFSEVTLTPVLGTEVELGTVAIGSGDEAHTIRRTTTIVRFADPRWASPTENELAHLLGEEEIRDLRSFAGLPGGSAPERLFGSTGERLTKSLRAHNARIIDTAGHKRRTPRYERQSRPSAMKAARSRRHTGTWSDARTSVLFAGCTQTRLPRWPPLAADPTRFPL
jgi:hypothetical protein